MKKMAFLAKALRVASCLTVSVAGVILFGQTASAEILLSDDFMVTSNSQNVNQQLSGRQSGPLAPAYYTGWQIHHQVGNTSTDVGQPGGATNGNYVLLALNGSFMSDLNIATVASGPLTIQFNMYLHGANPGGAPAGYWGACTLRAASGNDPCWPIAGSGEFGFLVDNTGAVQIFQNGGNIQPTGWNVADFATNALWTLVFSDPTGTGSAFDGNGSQVTFINGTNTLGTVPLSQLNSAGLRLGFRDYASQFVGIANLVISGTPGVLAPAGQNLSFEYEACLPGTSDECIPAGWTAFNEPASGDFGSQNAGGVDYSTYDPLAPTADGSQYAYVNVFSGDATGGLYQDMGPLLPNHIYTLTVAIGSRADRLNSPGIISLLNGTDNTGTVLATGGGLPSTQDTWQDYTISYATGAAVSGDLVVTLSAAGAGTIQADFDNVRLTSVASVVPLPTRVQDTLPASATVALGSNVVFSAAYSNLPPVTLQWQQIANGMTNNINSGVVDVTSNGVLTSTLTLNDVQLTSAGSYRLQAVNATNSAGVVYSSAAPLTVVPLITWYPPGAYNGTFVDNTVLALAGPVSNEVYGVDFGGAGYLTTANGYTFNDYAASGNMIITGGGLGTYGQYFQGGSGDNSLDLMLAIGIDGSSADMGILTNLTVGQPYTVLVLLDDTRSSGAGGTYFHLTDGITDSPAQQYAFVNGTPAIGGYIMGTFTAKATTQPLSVFLDNGNCQYNAILVEKGIAPPPANPPAITTDVPLLSEVAAGKPYTLSVVAAGAVPLRYQWSNANGPISGATNASYTFTALNGTNSYFVTVTNAYYSAVSSTAVVIASLSTVTVNNFSFEDGTLPGPDDGSVPVLWTSFKNNNFSAVGDSNYSILDPLAPPAQGNDFFGINEGPGDPTGGIYQDVGPLQANTTYTLTVAIGRRMDFTAASGLGSPGIISLINGTSDTGVLLATTNGIPATPDTWQDYSITYTTGASVSGDLVVELSVAGASTYQANFDNVILTQTQVPLINPPTVANGKLILTGTLGAAGANYVVLTTTNLAAPITWTTNTTGTLDGTGSFSNAIPINISQPAQFFQVFAP